MTKNEHIRVYVSPDFKQKIKEKAKKQGLEASPWLRSIAKRKVEEGQA